MTILIQQDYAQANDSLGMRAKVRPQDIKSGTYYGQLQLRGSILVIKDAQNAVSGYIAFGTDITTVPTSPTTGTGLFQDYSGLYGNNGGVAQFYWTSADGVGYAGAGAVKLDSTGIVMNSDGGSYLRWVTGSTLISSMSTSHSGGTTTNTFYSTGAGANAEGQIVLNAANSTTAESALINVFATAANPTVRLISNGSNVSNVYLTQNNFRAVQNAATMIFTFADSKLDITGTAPSLELSDSTGSAKSLLITVDANKATFEEAGGTDILVMDLTNAAVYLSDTSNADMTIGLTINQGANDNQIFALKSSDVAHGVTTLAETDTFGYITKFSGTDGGISFVGLNDTAAVGVRVAGVSTVANSTKTTGGLGAVLIDGFLASGTGVASLGANSNILAVRDNGTTRFILDADGDSHQDVGTAWTNFDEHDDLALLNLMSAHVTRQDDPLRENFGAWLEQSRDDLERLKLVAFNANGHHFVNWSRMQMLQVGALRQIGERLERLEREHHH